ncbi:hypothetical protein [Neobacillus vireti]|uniref:hypothetical protein n=1 Tax=Neobacillus vireti TaxID=220686 RepID=UPI0030004CA5
MTAVNQNFTMYQGDSKNLIVAVEGVTDLIGVTLKWGLRKREYDTTNLVLKENEITVSGTEIRIPLKPPDTETLLGTYYHECELTDQQGNVSTLFTGIVTILRSAV